LDLKLLLTTFGLLFLAELGDKTQLSVFTPVAKHKEPLPIFIGAGAALVLVTAIAVVVGQGVAAVVPEDTLKKAAAVMFAVIGILIWFGKF
jgi:putative Ca2+/H+ antiporter (TMEM165/GDT1 family)